MIEHLVFFKLKEGVSQDDKSAMLTALRALPEAIPEIRYLACGTDFSGRAQGFQVGLIVRFDDRASLEVYGPHPQHKAFGENFRHLWDDVMALDFEG